MGSFTSTPQTMMGTPEDFLEKFKQRVVNESNNLTNSVKFLVELFNAGVLSDDSSDTEVSEVFKKMIAQYAMTKVCSKGADAIGGLMKALEKSENWQLISALRTWVTENFPTEITEAGVQSRPDYGAADVHTVASKQLSQNQLRSSMESSSVGPKLLDKILSHIKDDIIDELEDRWVRQASKIVNVPAFCASLVHQKVLKMTDTQWRTQLRGQEESWTKWAIKVACSKKAMGSLVFAFQSSGNESNLEETLEWIETTIASKKFCPIHFRSLAITLIQGGGTRVNFATLEQIPPLHNLEEFEKLDNHQWDPSTRRTFNLELDREKMIGHFAGFGVTLWNWRANEAQKINLKVRFDNVTCMQSDEEILVLGTADGCIRLFDATKVKQKCIIGLGNYEPVHSLKFVESTLVVLIRGPHADKIWWVDISRTDMELLNERLVRITEEEAIVGCFVHPEFTFLNMRCLMTCVYSTKSGIGISEDCRSCWLDPPADMRTLSVVDLVSTTGNIIGGCENGVLAMWNTNEFFKEVIPRRVIHGHKAAVVSLCAINGHLLSLDQSGKLFMWSGYDLEAKYGTPVPLVVAENVSNVTILVKNGRWFCSSLSKDDVARSGTLPYLCLAERCLI